MNYPEDFINKIICGDCLEVMPDIPDKSIDMILCDLPYGDVFSKWDLPLDLLWRQYSRIIKDNRAVVLIATQPFCSVLVMGNLEWFKYNWVWDKVRGVGHLKAKKQPMMATEDILIFGRGFVQYNPQMRIRDKPRKSQNTGVTKYYKGTGIPFEGKILNERYPINLIQFSKSSQNDLILHPNQKPVALFEYLILTYTNESDLVLDNCAGSGTTGVACKNLKRNYILIEKEEKYCEIAENRLKAIPESLFS